MKNSLQNTIHWPKVAFGDVVRNMDESVRDPQNSGLDRYVGLEHIDPESLHIQRWGLISEGISFTRRFRKGQVLFGKRRAYQRKVAVAEFDGLCSSDILVFEPKDDRLLPELLPFICQSDGFFEHALDTSAGSLSPRTKFKELARYEFPLPPLDEQRRIAEILWAIDNTLIRYQVVFDQTEQLIDRHALGFWGNPNLYKHHNNHIDLVDSPRYWKNHELSEICIKIQDGTHFSPTTDSGEYRYVTSKNIKDGFLSLEDCGWISKEEHDQIFKRCNVQQGDLLLTKDGANTGNVAINVISEPFSLLSSVAMIRTDHEKLCNKYLFYFLRSKPGRNIITQQMKGTAIPRVTLSIIKKTKIPVPKVEDQQVITSLFDELYSSREKILDAKIFLGDVRKKALTFFLGGHDDQ